MKNNELVTVIIPIYNVDEYLEDCIDSMLDQTYTNLEILLIDDGSRDKSGEIADNYTKIDSRVKVYHKLNGGLSDARNYGIDRASGKYLTFVDSDDYVSKEFVEVLYNNLIDFDADVSGCVFRRTTKRYKDKEHTSEERMIMVWDTQTALKKMLRQEDEFTTSACALLYKKECFDHIRYPKGACYEDLGTTYRILHSVKRVVRTSKCLYHYYTRVGSISNNNFSPKYMDQYRFARDIESFIKKEYPELIRDAESRLIGVCFNIYMSFSKEQLEQYDDYAKELTDTINEYRWKLLKNDETPKKVKAACLLSYAGMPLCSFIYKKLQLKGK